MSLTHWGKLPVMDLTQFLLGSIYDFTTLKDGKPIVLDTIKEYDQTVLEGLKKLKFKAFDFEVCLNKAPIPDYPAWGIFMKLVQTFLDEEEYRCRMLPDEEFFKAYQEVGELTVHGQSWSLPDLTKDRSSISFVSASLRRFFKKCWRDPPAPVSPQDKSCY